MGCAQDLSIIGEGKRQAQAVHGNVGIVGEDNKVTCPEGMVVQYSAIGEDNKLRFHDHGDD